MWVVEFKTFRNEWVPCKVCGYFAITLAVFPNRKSARAFKKTSSHHAEGIKYRERKIGE